MKYWLNYILVILTSSSLLAQNIALQKYTSASSVRDNNLASYAVDGDQSTRWESNWSDPQFLTVDLATIYSINRVEIDWEAAYASQYQIEVSNDGHQWTMVSSITNGNGGTDVISLNGQNARYVRMYGTQRTTIGNAQYGYSIFEFEIYGEAATNNASLSNIFIDGNEFTAFASDQYNYDYFLKPGVYSVPTVSVTTANPNAFQDISNAESLPGTTTITVTSADRSSTETYTINFKASAYSLVWSDEFDNTGAPDPTKWHHQTYPPVGNSWFNGEEQHYTSNNSNSYVDNGSLKIKAVKESYTDPTSGSTKQYTSARLNSKYAFKYGRMEVRAKLPAALGTWPAIWTLGKNINENGAYWQTQGYGNTTWPYCGEIDIMEQDEDKSKTSGAFHFPNNDGNATHTTKSIRVNDTANNWHVYAMEWSAETIELTVDDVVFHTLDNSQNAYFDNEHFILLNIAMGGDLGGPIPHNFSFDFMEIDYVRVYQLQPLSSGKIDKQNIEVNIYPNPSKGMLNIEASDVIKEVMIYDLMGRPLLQYGPLNAKTSVSLNQPPGVYLIKVTGDKLEKVKKLIVN